VGVDRPNCLNDPTTAKHFQYDKTMRVNYCVVLGPYFSPSYEFLTYIK
jgi:hypothetical protein